MKKKNNASGKSNSKQFNFVEYVEKDKENKEDREDQIDQIDQIDQLDQIDQDDQYVLNEPFLVDKYIPSNVLDIFDPVYEYYENLSGKTELSWESQSPSKCYFHKEILSKLKIISSDDCMPHSIFYGNPGSGKKTLINLFLEMIFDNSIYNLDDSKYTVISSGNIENEVIVKQSDHHIIIEPNNNNFDRYLIQDIVKEYARRYPLCIFEKSRNFKIVLINNLDNLSYYAQTSLRRTIEKYSKTCRFIMWCHSLSKVIEPLRSRCLCIHVPTQTNNELIKWTFNIASLESIKLDFKTLTNIVESSSGNLKNILWKLDMYRYCGKINNCYQKGLINLINEIMSSHNIEVIRDFIYKMMITNISSNTIIKDILNIILTKINDYPKNKIFKIIDAASMFEYRLSKGRRDIIHIETFLENIVNILK
jgi:replication factor C subunit 3/5